MAIATLDELARAACIGVFGGLAGTCTLAFPGSPIWMVPAGLAVVGCAATYPEVRAELARQVPALAEPLARVRAALPVRPPWPGGHGDPDEGEAGDAPDARAAAQAAGHPPALLDRLAQAPHRLIIGHTRGGKTTLLHALATGWAAEGQRVLVADPDAAPGQWPGCEVAGGGDDMPAIAALFDEVRAEVARRRAARAQGERVFAPLHLVIDEAQDVLPDAGGYDLFEDIARRGAKLGVRLTVGVQDKQVATLGLEGKSAILRNLETVDVMRTAGGRVAVLRHPVTGEREQYPVPDLPDPEQFIRRPAPAPPPPPPAAAPDPARAAVARILALDVARAAVPAISPERAERLARILARAEEGADTGTTASGRHAPGLATAPGTGITIERDTGTGSGTTASGRPGTGIEIDTADGHVTVNVTQIAGMAGGRGRRSRPPRLPTMRGRSERLARLAEVRALVAQGLAANEIHRRIGGNRKEVLDLVRRVRGGGRATGT